MLVDAITRQREVVGHRRAGGAAQGGPEPAPDHRRHPGRRRPAHPRDGRAEQLLDAAARLRVLQHAALVLRHLRAPAPAQAAVRGRARSSTAAPSTRRNTPGNGRRTITAPPGVAERRPARQLLERLDDALLALRADESGGSDRRLPEGRLRPRAAGADAGRPPRARRATTRTTRSSGSACSRTTAARRPHDRDRLLLACAKHTAGHRKYGDPLEATGASPRRWVWTRASAGPFDFDCCCLISAILRSRSLARRSRSRASSPSSFSTSSRLCALCSASRWRISRSAILAW